MKYRIKMCTTVWEWRTFEIEARNEQEAGKRAIDCLKDEQVEIPIDQRECVEIEVIDCEELAAAK